MLLLLIPDVSYQTRLFQLFLLKQTLTLGQLGLPVLTVHTLLVSRLLDRQLTLQQIYLHVFVFDE